MKLSQFINKYMKNPISIKVYAVLCDKSEEEIQELFERDDY